MVLRKHYESDELVGVIGAGSFGTALAKLLAENRNVLMYARTEEEAAKINNPDSEVTSIPENISATHSIEKVATECTLLFPSVPSAHFRDMMRELAPHVSPSHIIIHGTKGFDISQVRDEQGNAPRKLSRETIRTMSEVIREESVVVRIGCVAGPNIAGELKQGQPAATVIASRFNEVVNEGIYALRSSYFQVYASNDIIGVELASSLKNVIAIAAGALEGLGLGVNAKALLISRGMAEMTRIGAALGGDKHAFLGLAGIGDLIATCSSPHSRNFKVGHLLAHGKSLQDILNPMEEVAEGVETVRITKKLVDQYRVRAPIVQTVYRVVENKMTVNEGLQYLMSYPFEIDVDFI
jgi:glycerol-3-phosphate dehydrogenase (NAD(P)+)